MPNPAAAGPPDDRASTVEELDAALIVELAGELAGGRDPGWDVFHIVAPFGRPPHHAGRLVSRAQPRSASVMVDGGRVVIETLLRAKDGSTVDGSLVRRIYTGGAGSGGDGVAALVAGVTGLRQAQQSGDPGAGRLRSSRAQARAALLALERQSHRHDWALDRLVDSDSARWAVAHRSAPGVLVTGVGAPLPVGARRLPSEGRAQLRSQVAAEDRALIAELLEETERGEDAGWHVTLGAPSDRGPGFEGALSARSWPRRRGCSVVVRPSEILVETFRIRPHDGLLRELADIQRLESTEAMLAASRGLRGFDIVEATAVRRAYPFDPADTSDPAARLAARIAEHGRVLGLGDPGPRGRRAEAGAAARALRAELGRRHDPARWAVERLLDGAALRWSGAARAVGPPEAGTVRSVS